MFNMSQYQSFEGVYPWNSDLREKVHLEDGYPIPVVLLANMVFIIFRYL